MRNRTRALRASMAVAVLAGGLATGVLATATAGAASPDRDRPGHRGDTKNPSQPPDGEMTILPIPEPAPCWWDDNARPRAGQNGKRTTRSGGDTSQAPRIPHHRDGCVVILPVRVPCEWNDDHQTEPAPCDWL